MDSVYTVGQVRGYLCNYQRRALGARPRRPEDKLAVRVPPLEEAPYAASSCVWSDIEQAMKALPFNWEKITFAVLCLGGGKEGSSWRNGMSAARWREKVGDFWCLSAGEINKIVGAALEEMTYTLNGAAFDNDPVDVSRIA